MNSFFTIVKYQPVICGNPKIVQAIHYHIPAIIKVYILIAVASFLNWAVDLLNNTTPALAANTIVSPSKSMPVEPVETFKIFRIIEKYNVLLVVQD